VKNLLTTVLLLLFVSNLFPQEQKTTPQCALAVLNVSLNAGDDYERRIDDLTFEVRASEDKGNCQGWMFALEDSGGNDYIYPVNPPLRFNPSQLLGCGYGQSARESLKLDRELYYLLNKPDYNQLSPLLVNALWPYSAPHPDRAGEEYLTALKKLHMGLLRLKILSFEVAPDDTVRSAKLQVDLIAPSDFRFDPSLKRLPTTCPPKFQF
jgi:hypothetical protein